jgi:hypothetical protein
LVELKVSLVKAFGWSLLDIDNTDIESLLPFISQMSRKTTTKGKKPVNGHKIYCDDPSASWL